MDRPTCESCPYWHAEIDDNGTADDVAECRRNPPQISGLARNVHDPWDVLAGTYYPVTSQIDWCGMHPAFPAWLDSLRAAAAKETPRGDDGPE